ncbi:hypothetical protein PR048_026925 [Dryococelus australis]|uniref:Uncharacterized protein n=1 Tax=Dryococelus australis TaxID=614101 RepID=A0ABQ9GMM9_9NEOP|nr:hypothetical protein PR048_026925 [Dryococelus australis]
MGGHMLQMIHAFHMSEHRWEVLETHRDPLWGYPCGRCYHGFVQQGSRVFIMGGYNEGQILGDMWRLELRTLCWTALCCHLPQNVYFHSTAVTTSGCLYCFGGVRALQADCSRTADLYKMWLCVPSLEVMCCEAVRHYARHSPLFSRQHLARYGLPKNILASIFS